MALSYRQYTGNGVTTSFSYSGILLLPSDVVALSAQFVIYADGVVVDPSDYTISSGTETIVFSVAPANGVVIRIARETDDTARVVDYTDGSNLSAALLDVDADQLFFLIQEIIDGVDDSLVKDTDGIWNAESVRIKNVGAGTSANDAVTLAQLQAAMSGVSPTAVSGYGMYTATGDGSTTTYSLVGGPSSKTVTDYLVTLNGLVQTPTTHYTVTNGTPDSIVFATAPPSSQKIEVRWVTGTVVGTVADGTITDDKVATGADIDPTKLAKSVTNGRVLATMSGSIQWYTLTSAEISDFGSAVLAKRLDQFAAPTASVSMNSQKITNLATPASSNDAVNLSYLTSNYKKQSKQSATGSGTAIAFTVPFVCGSYLAFITGSGTGADTKTVGGTFSGDEAHAHTSGPTVTRSGGGTIVTFSVTSGTVRVTFFEQ